VVKVPTGGRLGGFAGERGHGGERADRLVGQPREGGADVVGGGDELGLVGTGPCVGKGFRGILDGLQILDPEGGQFAQRFLGGGGGCHEADRHGHESQTRADHHGAFLDAVEVARHSFAGCCDRGVQRLHGRLDPGRVLRERVLHRNDDAESKISVHVRIRSSSSRSKASCRSRASTNSRRTRSGSARVSE
jgi:hypothetical protein